MVRITQDVYKRMVELRQAGAPYSDIMAECNVSKWACIKYLKDLNGDDDSTLSKVTKEWRDAEIEAASILTEMGFSHIVDLNEICNVAPFWDFYAEKDGDKWLVDVTVNHQKSVTEKQTRAVDGYRMAILFKDVAEWRLIEIKAETICKIEM